MNPRDLLIERCPSGVPGFDDLCQGGLVRNSVNVLIGGPGAGKTTFLMNFLWNGVNKFNENGLFVSFEPDVLELFKDASTYGWDFEKLDSRGTCKFMKVSPQTSMSELKKELTRVVTKYGIKRLCFDPVSMLGSMEGDESKARQEIYDLMALFKRLQVTVLFSDEAPSQEEAAGVIMAGARSQFTRFLTDGVIDLYSSGLGGVSDRAVRIVKMRRTNHSRGPIPMHITNEGIVVLSKKGKGLGL